MNILTLCLDLESFPLPLLVHPFLRVILSPRTTGPVTSIALQGVHRLISYGIIKLPRGTGDDEVFASRPETKDGQIYFHRSSTRLAIAEIAHAVSHCRFEASEAVADELVLLRILAVMRELICGDGATAFTASDSDDIFLSAPLANCLGDESICEMMETGLSMCCQMRLSDLLRRTAEQSMTTMVRALFSRLSVLPLSADDAHSADPNVPNPEPEHATLAADPVGEDAVEAYKDKRLRRMTMPDPASLDFPAASDIPPSALQELKEIGEQEEDDDAKTESQLTSEKPKGSIAEQSLMEQAPEPSPSAAPLQGRSAESSKEQAEIPNESSDAESMNAIPVEVQPFGLPAIKEVLRVIVSLLDPHNSQHTDAMRLLGLSMLCSVFEVAGHSIGRFPSLRAIIQDSACKHLFQLIRSENSTVLTYALRTTSALCETMREHLKLQNEVFLTFLLDRLAPTFPLASEPWKEDIHQSGTNRKPQLLDSKGFSRTSTPDLVSPSPPPPPPLPKTSGRSPAHGESRELIIEAFNLFLSTHIPRLDGVDPLVELWINYDCDVDCENMFEKVIHFLCRSVYAANPLHPQIQESIQLFSIDVILNFVSSMAARQENASAGLNVEHWWPEGLPSAENLVKQKQTKASILLGAEKFNNKPKDGLKYFEEQGFIDTTGSDASRDVNFARFLKDCPRLDKKVLGDFLSRPDNAGILDAFLRLFDFSGTPIAEAMREMLEAFRLPGESQQISRITETFAKIYFASDPSGIKSEDAVYVLSYSVIMLNTDLHNPQNKRRMTIDDYRRNLRGVNDNTDFEPDFLGSIYDSIRRREIVMPEEHKGQLGFDYTWKELLRRSRKAGNLLSAPTLHFDKAIFEASWRPVVASIAFAFSTFRDEHILERAISGFRQCAVLASRFGMHELFDYMIQSLAGATGLLDSNGVGQLTNNSVVEVENQKITISPLSVQFGRNFKGQLAAVVLFTIANGNGNAVRKGWLPIFEIFKNLFINSLLSSSIARMYEFGSEEAKSIPLKVKRPPGIPTQDPRSQSGAGLFSTISSYLLSPYSVEKEQTRPDVAVTEEAVESSLCTADCVGSCRIEDLYAELMLLHPKARHAALKALEELANRYTVERRAQLLSDAPPGSVETSSGRSTPIQGITSGGPLRAGQALPYDPCAAFVLELAINLASSADTSESKDSWVILIDHITTLITSPTDYHPTQLERAIVALLRLAMCVYDVEEIHDQVYLALDRLNGLPSEIRSSVAAQVTAGICEILMATTTFARSQTEWSILFSLLWNYGNTRSAAGAKHAFKAVQSIVRKDSLVSPENFNGLVTVLRDFAMLADPSRHEVSLRTEPNQARITITEKKSLEEFREACQERGPAAVETLDLIRMEIPRLSQSAGSIAIDDIWRVYWEPLMKTMAQQCANGHRGTRQAALTHLQRTLLAPEILSLGDTHSTHAQKRRIAEHIFEEVLFPTLDELLKPEVFHLDPGNESGSMLETRIRACNILCKVYLHYLHFISQAFIDGEPDEKFTALWLHILDFFDRFMHSGKRDQLVSVMNAEYLEVMLTRLSCRWSPHQRI